MVSVFHRQDAPGLEDQGPSPDDPASLDQFWRAPAEATAWTTASVSAGPVTPLADEILLGTAGDDVLRGDNGRDQLFGFRGDDRLIGGAGADRLHGGGGDDVLIGGFGADRLSGGGGADLFIFRLVEGSQPGAALRDRIGDFSRSEGDRIDLSAMDANTNLAGDQAFVLGGGSFTGQAGELIQFLDFSRWTILAGDIDGDGQADFELAFRGTLSLIETDFLL
jgi:Ca2+-binding RTX toxin-like protein